MTTYAGIVESYDSPAGLGVVQSRHWGRLGFHCTQIANGSREIEPGTSIVFEVIAAGPGRWEAGNLVKMNTAQGDSQAQSFSRQVKGGNQGES